MAVDKKIQPIPDFKPIQEPNPEAEILIEDARREANSEVLVKVIRFRLSMACSDKLRRGAARCVG